MTLDKFDLAILRALSTNGRISHVELGRQVGLSPTACARRQQALEEAGVIAGYQAEIAPAKLGLTTTVVVRITLEKQSEEALARFEEAVRKCPSIVRCLLMSGSDDYTVTVLARDIADYERIHKMQLSRLPGVARLQSSFAMRAVINRAIPIEAL
ncbi:Lrp/AsnC family transcriptional regulator [Phreatobacter stygius]|uniref:Lrp/AsnC family transcriptional regulator n=1 Tax=Phreatobacter stygius TaxID=1940610 RepID=A0A4D7BC59_9HYPH|nr:Lrp/AsnC family transcriptional regulator [Phreatobacter stygius]QCI67638.1 Lrp/AsnC family transcriptional regulator [Phreatobacter stygius]